MASNSFSVSTLALPLFLEAAVGLLNFRKSWRTCPAYLETEELDLVFVWKVLEEARLESFSATKIANFLERTDGGEGGGGRGGKRGRERGGKRGRERDRERERRDGEGKEEGEKKRWQLHLQLLYLALTGGRTTPRQNIISLFEEKNCRKQNSIPLDQSSQDALQTFES